MDKYNVSELLSDKRKEKQRELKRQEEEKRYKEETKREAEQLINAWS